MPHSAKEGVEDGRSLKDRHECRASVDVLGNGEDRAKVGTELGACVDKLVGYCVCFSPHVTGQGNSSVTLFGTEN